MTQSPAFFARTAAGVSLQKESGGFLALVGTKRVRAGAWGRVRKAYGPHVLQFVENFCFGSAGPNRKGRKNLSGPAASTVAALPAKEAPASGPLVIRSDPAAPAASILVKRHGRFPCSGRPQLPWSQWYGSRRPCVNLDDDCVSAPTGHGSLPRRLLCSLPGPTLQTDPGELARKPPLQKARSRLLPGRRS